MERGYRRWGAVQDRTKVGRAGYVLSPRLAPSPAGALVALLSVAAAPAPGQTAPRPARLEPIVVHVVDRETTPDDGYWEWLPGHLEQEESARERIEEIRIELELLAADVRSHRKEWLNLLYLDNRSVPGVTTNPGWVNYFLSFVGQGQADANVDEEFRAEVDDIFHRWTSGWVGAPLEPESALPGERTAAGYKARRDAIRQHINEAKQRQRELIREAAGLINGLVRSLQNQADRSGDLRPQISHRTRAFEAEEKLIRLELYDAAQWYDADGLPSLIAELGGFLSEREDRALLVSARSRLAEARGMQQKIELQLIAPLQAPPSPQLVRGARAKSLEAMHDLRRAVEANPSNESARSLLRKLELEWVERLSARITQERQLSLSAFRQYFTHRGLSPDDGASWGGLDDYLRAIWGLGPIALTAGVVGLPQSLAEQTGAEQARAARHQVSLLIVRRLVKNGVTLTQIPMLSREDFEQSMAFLRVDGKALDERRVTQLFVETQQTLADLPALAALVSNQAILPEHFAEDVGNQLDERYYAPIDPTYSSAELFGDLLNFHNIVTLWAPGAVVKSAGGFAQRSSVFIPPGRLAAAVEAGEVTLGIDAFARGLRLDRAARALGATRAGQRTLASWNALQARTASAGWTRWSLEIGSQLGAAVTLFGGLGVLAETYDVPGGYFLVEVLAELSGSSLLHASLAKGGVPVGQLARRLDDHAVFLALARRELSIRVAAIEELERLAARLADESISGAQRAALERQAFELARRQTLDMARTPTLDMARTPTIDMAQTPTIDMARTPTIDMAQTPTIDMARTTTIDMARTPTIDMDPMPRSSGAGLEHAADSAAAALARGDVAEAERALGASSQLRGELTEAIEEASNRHAAAQRALSNVQEGAADPAFLARLDADGNAVLLPRGDNGVLLAPTKFRQIDFYAEEGAGSLLRAGDDALRANDFEAAAHNYRLAREQLEVSLAVPGLDQNLRYAQGRLGTAHQAADWRAMQELVKTGDTDLSRFEAIGGGKSREVLERWKRGDHRPIQDPEAVFTRPLSSTGSARPIEDLRNPVVEVFDDARTRYILKRAQQFGGVQASEVEVLATEAACTDLARLVGIRASPARFVQEENILLMRSVTNATEVRNLPEHAVVALKRDMARARVFRAWLGDADGHFRNQMVDAGGHLVQIDFDLATFSHTSRHFGTTFSDARNTLDNVLLGSHMQRHHGPYGWIARIDEMTRYEDVADVIGSIQQLSAQSGVLENVLAQAGYPTDKIADAAQILRDRAELMPEMVEEFFERTVPRMAAELRAELTPVRVAP